MKFDFEKFKGEYVMWCKTEEEANNFCELMGKKGKIPLSDNQHPRNTCWNVYETQTCYDFNTGGYGHKQNYENRNYIILKWSYYMDKEKEFTLKDLKAGMLVKKRSGEFQVVIPTKQGIGGFDKNNLYKSNFSKDNYGHNLNYIFHNDNSYDIVEVYDVIHEDYDKLFETFNRKLLWKRKEKEIKYITMGGIRKAVNLLGDQIN